MKGSKESNLSISCRSIAREWMGAAEIGAGSIGGMADFEVTGSDVRR